MEMTKYKLDDLCRIASSKRIFESEYVDQGIPFIRGQEISDGSILDPKASFECYISQDRYEEIKEKYGKPSKGDILITAVGTIGNLCYLDKDIDFYFKDGNVIWFSEIIPSCEGKFLFHFMKSSFFKAQLKYFMIGAVQKALTIDMLKKVEVPLPSLPEQKKIASVLSALDNKIALNKKMNQKLEAMAKRLYDYWFVQYDFPDKNGLPYKTTGGPMTYNPILKREIPAGWEVSSFIDFGFFKNGINYDKNEVGDETVKIVNVRNISDSTTYFNIDELDDITLKSDDIQKFVATPKDILLARSGSPGATRLLPQTDKKIIYCGFIIRYQLNEQDLDKQLYLFHVLKGYELVTSTQSAGSILKNISQDTLNALTVVMPQSSVLDAFNKRITPIYSMLRKNISELNKLTTLRDRLLPLLMNGQVIVD